MTRRAQFSRPVQIRRDVVTVRKSAEVVQGRLILKEDTRCGETTDC